MSKVLWPYGCRGGGSRIRTLLGIGATSPQTSRAQGTPGTTLPPAAGLLRLCWCDTPPCVCRVVRGLLAAEERFDFAFSRLSRCHGWCSSILEGFPGVVHLRGAGQGGLQFLFLSFPLSPAAGSGLCRQGQEWGHGAVCARPGCAVMGTLRGHQTGAGGCCSRSLRGGKTLLK